MVPVDTSHLQRYQLQQLQYSDLGGHLLEDKLLNTVADVSCVP